MNRWRCYLCLQWFPYPLPGGLDENWYCCYCLAGKPDGRPPLRITRMIEASVVTLLHVCDEWCAR